MTPQRQLEHHIDALSHRIDLGKEVDTLVEKLVTNGRVEKLVTVEAVVPRKPGDEPLHYVNLTGGNLFEQYKRWADVQDQFGALTSQLHAYGTRFSEHVLGFAHEVASKDNLKTHGVIHLCAPGAIPAPAMSDHERWRYDSICKLYNVEPFSKRELSYEGTIAPGFTEGPVPTKQLSEIVLNIEPTYKGSVSQLVKFFGGLERPFQMHYARLVLENESERGYLLEANMNEMRLSPLVVPVEPRVFELWNAIPTDLKQRAA